MDSITVTSLPDKWLCPISRDKLFHVAVLRHFIDTKISTDVETADHLLISCAFAKEVAMWKYAAAWVPVAPSEEGCGFWTQP
ncbi:hypothetical protein L1887_17002 [Cichorium endivia]|nr:hypothetical protein L1887_17002 [Cichorium endivia]